MLNRLFHLVVKELLALLRDPQSRGILIGPPLIQIFVLSFAVTQEVRNVTVAVFNQDVGDQGELLVRRFEQSRTFAQVHVLSRHEQINQVIDTQRVMGVVVIPQDFSRDIHAGRTAEVQVLLDGRKTNAAPILGGYITKIATRFVEERRGIDSGVQVVTRNWFNVNLDPRKTTVPSLVCVLATVLGMLISALSIARERETGTFEQLLVSPLGPLEILVGKAVPAVFLATCSAVMMIGITIFLLNIPLAGSFWLLILSMDLFLLTVVGVGLFISSLSMTQQQAILGVILVLPSAIMLSGFATPVENMPVWLQHLTVVNPVRWYLVIVKGVFLKGMGPHEVFLNCIPLALLSAVTLSAATFMFKRRME